MYKNVIFDFDGTLMNTFAGIYNSFEYALKSMGQTFPGVSFVKESIGVPLTYAFENQLGFSKATSEEAVRLFRDFYEKKGKLEAYAYDGIKETLDLLRRKKCLLGIATLKREKYAKEMIQQQNWSHYFATIHGMDEEFVDSKESLIRKCMVDLNAYEDDTILVGDGISDFLGAKNVGIAFMAVTYGFGLYKDTVNAYTKKDILYIAHTGYEIGRILDTNP